MKLRRLQATDIEKTSPEYFVVREDESLILDWEPVENFDDINIFKKILEKSTADARE